MQHAAGEEPPIWKEALGEVKEGRKEEDQTKISFFVHSYWEHRRIGASSSQTCSARFYWKVLWDCSGLFIPWKKNFMFCFVFSNYSFTELQSHETFQTWSDLRDLTSVSATASEGGNGGFGSKGDGFALRQYHIYCTSRSTGRSRTRGRPRAVGNPPPEVLRSIFNIAVQYT